MWRLDDGLYFRNIAVKNARNYLNNLEVVDFNPKFLGFAIIRIIKQAQIDAIEATIERCSEEYCVTTESFYDIEEQLKKELE